MGSGHGLMDAQSGIDPVDQKFMKLAIELASRGQGFVEPNPMVGCVIARGNQVLAQGYHRKFGEAHAEVDALNQLSSPTDGFGATAYVTLEPCCHTGKTPPCSQALIRSRVGRVVVAMQDPFTEVDGGGIGQLREAGIEVNVGLLKSEAEQLNRPYLKRLSKGTPWVIGKWAMTADGRIATRTGESQWITNEKSREHVHILRSRVDAVIVGMGTVIADDPMLTARLKVTDGVPDRVATRVVFCRSRVPSVDSKLVRSSNDVPTLLFVGPNIKKKDTDPLTDRGVEIVVLDTDQPDAMIEPALCCLGQKGMTNVMVEGGAELLGSFRQSLDECHVYMGPLLFGGQFAPGPIGGQGSATIASSPEMELLSLDQFGNDFRAIYRTRKI